MDIKPGLEFSIDELILRGLPAKDAYQIGEALQLELDRLFREEGIPPLLKKGSNLASLKVVTPDLTGDMPPQTIGQQIATGIYEGFSPKIRK